MMEGIENNPDVWVGLFPQNFQRRLVREFVESVSYVPTVEVVVCMSKNDGDGKKRDILFVIVEGNIDGIPTPDELGDISCIHSKVCKTKEDEELLLTEPVTEAVFLDMKRTNLEFRYTRGNVLWRRPKDPRDESIHADFNCYLN